MTISDEQLRDRLRACFDAVLTEPVPQRLLDATARARSRPLGTAWLAMAASLACGMILGAVVPNLHHTHARIAIHRGEVAADAGLERALSQQLAVDASSGPVRAGVSFVSKSGQYCRTFVDGRERDAVAGLACRDSGAWRLKVLQTGGVEKPADQATYLPAATSLSPSILAAVQALMQGDLLDAGGETKGREQGWEVSSSGR